MKRELSLLSSKALVDRKRITVCRCTNHWLKDRLYSILHHLSLTPKTGSTPLIQGISCTGERVVARTVAYITVCTVAYRTGRPGAGAGSGSASSASSAEGYSFPGMPDIPSHSTKKGRNQTTFLQPMNSPTQHTNSLKTPHHKQGPYSTEMIHKGTLTTPQLLPYYGFNRT
jgi:hypothetical protein